MWRPHPSNCGGAVVTQAGFTGLKHTEEDVDNTIAAASEVMKAIAN